MSTPTEVLPKLGWEALIEHWRSDLLAGFLVFLIALPLCLGIALASGFPPAAGIITAVVGGLIVSRLNGSYVTINGPAAGLIVVILNSVQVLGEGDPIAGYHYTLAAIMLAGALQFLMGVNRLGQWSTLVPSAVVHGMLAAIGIIILAKQSHVLLGVTPNTDSIITALIQIPQSLFHPQPQIALIGLTGLGVLIVWPLLKQPTLKLIPAPIMVLVTGMLLGQFFGLQHEHLHPFLSSAEIVAGHEHLIAPQYLVDLPDQVSAFFALPDFAKMTSLTFWEAVLSICLVGSLETLLSANAVDKLDPYKRQSDLDQELTAVGLGNMIVGFIGGLPMIAEIVRSSANINNGAKTAWANFFHGLILAVFVVFFPQDRKSVV